MCLNSSGACVCEIRVQALRWTLASLYFLTFIVHLKVSEVSYGREAGLRSTPRAALSSAMHYSLRPGLASLPGDSLCPVPTCLMTKHNSKVNTSNTSLIPFGQISFYPLQTHMSFQTSYYNWFYSLTCQEQKLLRTGLGLQLSGTALLWRACVLGSIPALQKQTKQTKRYFKVLALILYWGYFSNYFCSFVCLFFKTGVLCVSLTALELVLWTRLTLIADISSLPSECRD